jgi:DNA-binding CsgD family transcriptional regulator
MLISVKTAASGKTKFTPPGLHFASERESIGDTVWGDKAEAAIDTLDVLCVGVFLLDARLRIVHANRSGHLMLAQRVLLRTADGCLTTREPSARRNLRVGIAMATTPNSALGRGLTVKLQATKGDPYLAHLLPLTAGERRRGSAMYETVAALFVHKVQPQISTLPEIIAAHYNLTPMEMRVLLAIVEMGRVPEVAEELGIARNTVKTHLLHVFAKTSARRQADLVKLVFAFSNPLLR